MQATALTSREISAALRDAIDEFTALLSGADVSVVVTGCPGWDVRDLAIHLGTIHRWAASIVLSGKMQPKPTPLIERPLHEWYRSTGTALLTALEAVAPGEPIPNFSGIHEHASFWQRRQLHEVTVHLHDLAQALSMPEPPVPAKVAADGTEEVLTVFFHHLAAKGSPADLRENIRIRTTDTGHEWVLALGDIGRLQALSTPSAAVISGSARELYLALWGRAPTEILHYEGDAARTLMEGATSV